MMPSFLSFRRWPATFCVILTAVSPLAAQTPNAPLPAAMPEDLMPELKTLLQTAVQQSPTMLAKSISIAKAEADRIVAKSVMWPSLGGNVQYASTTTSVSSGTTVATGAGQTTTSTGET